MPIMRIHYYAKALQMASVMHVVLPQNTPSQCAVVLLGPGGSDSTWWLRNCLLQPLADQASCAFILPAVLEGCGFDMAYGYRFGASLRKDIPEWLERYLPAIPTKNWHIAGYTSSGTAAIRMALTCPNRYLSAASFGGHPNPLGWFDEDDPYLTSKRLACIWGSRDEAAQYDLSRLRSQTADAPVVLMIAPEGSHVLQESWRISHCQTITDDLSDENAPRRCLETFLSFLSRNAEMR